MKIVIAPDKFKGSLSAPDAANAIAAGVLRACPEAETVLIPLADGGEGTMESLVASTGGVKVKTRVTNPLGQPVEAAYGWLGDRETCVVEMAAASGLALIPESQRRPLDATTYGTGELIRHALDAGCRRFIVAIGGSATTDGGAGMLQALGMKFFDENGRELEPGIGGGRLEQIRRIDDRNWDPRIADSRFIIASDVLNPLIGPNGAASIFAPQKGASPADVALLDRALAHWADLIQRATGKRVHDLPGAGAAGGIGAALAAFFPSETRRGVDLVIEYAGLEQALANASALFTGEGRIDAQTVSGKTPLGAAEAAHKRRIPVFVLAGSVGPGVEPLYSRGITSIHSIVSGPMPLDEAMRRGAELLTAQAEQVMRTWLAGRRR